MAVTKQQKYIKRVKQIIVEELENPELNGQIIGHRLGISRMHLHRKLKVAIGQSISTFILEIRLEKAQELLVGTDRQVTSIAYDLGFKDASYFARVFKKNLNCTPSQYRMIWQKRENTQPLQKEIEREELKGERQPG